MQAKLWRVAALSPWDGGDLTINALHLYSASIRVDTAAIISSSHHPSSGSLSSIAQDPPGSTVVFAASDVKSSGFFVQWEFSTAVEVDGMRIAGGDLSALTVFAFMGGVWVLVRDVRGLRGISALTQILPFCVREPRAGAVSCMTGDAVQDGVTGTPWTLPSGATIQTDINRGGVPMLRVQGSASVSLASTVAPFMNWTGSDITVEATIFYEAPPTGDAGMPLMVYCGESAPDIVYWSFGPSTDDSLIFYYWSGTQSFVRTSAGVVKRGRLTHIAISIQGASLRFFVDGRLVHTAARATTPIGGGNAWPLRIGCTQNAQVSLGSFAVSDVIFTSAAKYTTDFILAERWDGGSRILTPTSYASIGASSAVSAFSMQGHRAAMACDMEFGGSHRIYGSVSSKADPVHIPLRRRVRLHRSKDGYLVRETWSKVDGSYEFTEISGRYEYDVIAWDHEMSYRSVVANNLTPEAM